MASWTSATILLLLTFAAFLSESANTDVTKIAETVLADLLTAQTKRVRSSHLLPKNERERENHVSADEFRWPTNNKC